ncbi:Di-trans-poly-cis-decaprenylcistransferase-like protein [Corchorus olitorius]|uniref:Alkyl transferase n=1 Tax=Corchorus olitorius TaxID=93759 RepID=A0A1R3GM54_9ROSI|nr:Di-trans-poly-cis-decaprenylcistransferase-like protein [Corchorus olitorius]
MERNNISTVRSINQKLGNLLWKGVSKVLSVGPVPTHIAFIMNGNRRYEQNLNLVKGTGHRLGLDAMLTMLMHCCELGIKYVTVYAFSIDNYKRKPEEVERVMDLLKFTFELLTEKSSIAHHYNIKFHFSGNLDLLSEPVRNAAEELMAKTANYSKFVFTFCIAYTSTDEMVHAIQEACEERQCEMQELKRNCGDYEAEKKTVKIMDIEKHMYMAVAPDPDIVVRTAGENRLSNFLLWQTANSDLYSTPTLWPEMNFWHLVLAVLDYQRNHSYLKKKKKLL